MADQHVVEESESPGAGARRARRRTRVMWWTVAAVVAVAVIAVWIATSDNTAGDDRSSSPGTVATEFRVTVTFDDHGLHVTPASVNAGIIQFGFVDDRTKLSGSEALLYYEVQPNVGGDLITGVGGRVRVLLCPHRWFLTVTVNGAVKARVALDVSGTSSHCTTPVT